MSDPEPSRVAGASELAKVLARVRLRLAREQRPD